MNCFKYFSINVFPTILLIIFLVFSLTGCEDDNLYPFMVTSVGDRVTLHYIGQENVLPEKFYVITQGSWNGDPCNLRTTARPANDKACGQQSNITLGMVLKIRGDRIEKNEARLTMQYIDCNNCQAVDLEKLGIALQRAATSDGKMRLSERVEEVEKVANKANIDINRLNDKVDANMDETVVAVKQVHENLKGTQEVVMSHEKDIGELKQRSEAYEEVVAENSTKLKVICNDKEFDMCNKRENMFSDSVNSGTVAPKANHFDFLNK